jgi:hydrogenase nickel incorporation protein HypA/HybF
MHEIGIMEETLQLAIAQARASGAVKIHKLKIRVGALSGVEPDALRFAFDVLSRETPAAGASLEIEAVRVVCFCAACQNEFQPDGSLYACPVCCQFSQQVRKGRELELAALEVS